MGYVLRANAFRKSSRLVFVSFLSRSRRSLLRFLRDRVHEECLPAQEERVGTVPRRNIDPIANEVDRVSTRRRSGLTLVRRLTHAPTRR